MLNEEMKFAKVESQSFPLLKNSVYPVELFDVKAEQKPKYQSTEIETVLSFEFAVLGGTDVDGKPARKRLLNKNFVPTYLYISSKSGKNNLYKIVEALIKRDLTKDEEANGITGKTINYLIGKQCQVVLEKSQSKKDPNKFYSNIANFLTAEIEAHPLSAEEKGEIKENLDKNKKQEPVSVKDLGEEVAQDTPDFLRPENIPF